MKSKLRHALAAGLMPVVYISLMATAVGAPGDLAPSAGEPNYEMASGWWADLWNIWTPVGWKDHLHRFNVLWNGTVLAKPDMNRRSGGQGLQLSLTPDYEGWVRDFKADKLRHDDHQVRQGWNDDDAPVLWSEWTDNETRIRSEVFAHLPGGTAVQTGKEPLFLWLRLRVHEVPQSASAQLTKDFDSHYPITPPGHRNDHVEKCAFCPGPGALSAPVEGRDRQCRRGERPPRS